LSDFQPGLAWWQASDGKWYGPELHPEYSAPPPPQHAWPIPDLAIDESTSPSPDDGSPRTRQPKSTKKKKVVIAVAAVALAVAGVAIGLTRGTSRSHPQWTYVVIPGNLDVAFSDYASAFNPMIHRANADNAVEDGSDQSAAAAAYADEIAARKHFDSVVHGIIFPNSLVETDAVNVIRTDVNLEASDQRLESETNRPGKYGSDFTTYYQPAQAAFGAASQLLIGALGGTGGGPKPVPATSTTAAPTTTTKPPTVAQQIAADLTVHVDAASATGHTSDSDNRISLSFDIANTSGKAISAYQTSTRMTVTDNLGRTYSENLLSDCTAALAIGQSIPAPPVLNLGAISDGRQNCTVDSWSMNQFDETQIGMWNGLAAGAGTFTAPVTVTRITFADGTSLGDAVTGQPGT
jgi:hypothetical protein